MARRSSKFWNTRNTAIASLILAIPFIILGLILIFNPATLEQIDYNLGTILHDMRTPFRNEVAIGITTIGDVWSQTAITIIIASLLIALKEYKVAVWYSITMLLGALVLNNAVKSFFGRIRPEYVEALLHEASYAFPSGHSMGSMILLGGLAFIVYRLVRGKSTFKGLVIFFCMITVLAIGLSRIYLGVHYPSDVLGGFSLGAAWLMLTISAYGLIATK